MQVNIVVLDERGRRVVVGFITVQDTRSVTFKYIRNEIATELDAGQLDIITNNYRFLQNKYPCEFKYRKKNTFL
eukprot:TRINITY_DN947_c0_g1_i1.p2 TRINITY_DN947_c0_g1~~TRINITY_DN947_c0_g1_i1.p2  ORF type:complete len:74 (+),score=11.25 TRINITY_DN947_c0_g1_i1:84-305(+)